MRFVWEIWKLTQSRNIKKLATYLSQDEGEIRLNRSIEYIWDASRHKSDMEVFKMDPAIIYSSGILKNLYIDSKDYNNISQVEAAKILISIIVNRKIDKKVYPMLQSTKEGSISLQFIPRNLYGALWLQMAMALDGVGIYKKCLMCDRWFPTGNRFGARRGTEVCSEACQKRKERAGLSKSRKSKKNSGVVRV